MNSEDIKLFRSSVGSVNPVKHRKITTITRKPKPVPYQTNRDRLQVLKEMAEGILEPALVETGEELHFKRPGIQNRAFQKLRRGEYCIEAELDLHGYIVSEAKIILTRFLENTRKRKLRCVRIIHGKGLGSREGRPIIKHHINTWLRHRDEILAFSSALPRDGGSGAIYVLLKTSNQPKSY